MRFQKLLLLLSLILGGITVFYALSFHTGSLASIYNYTVEQQNDIINAQATFEFAQKVNTVLMGMGIAYIAVVVLMYITATQKRRNYYADNYVTVIVAAAYAAVFAIVAFVLIGMTSGMFYNDVDWAKYDSTIKGTLSDFGADRGGVMFILGYVLFSVVIVDALALVYNLIWKIKLMKGEKALLEGGLVGEVA